ncbi:MAG: ATP-binding protein [Parachlamydiaceae bacterium]
MKKRPFYLAQIALQLRVHPICALLGPRQVGKTTLAKMYMENSGFQEVSFFDLENPLDLARLENPMLTLSKLSNQLIVIDEIQRSPELFPVLRVLADETTKNRKFLILGSVSRDLIQQSSETLAGRIGYIEIMPFSLKEVKDSPSLWLKGGFPRSFLATEMEESFVWRSSFIMTFLERDIPQLGFQIPSQQMRRFWLMLAHYHGQMLNATELANSLAISTHAVRKYMDILAGTFMIRILNPWFENLGKRQRKSPKIYFRDSGLLHALLGIHNEKELDVYPKLGSCWEGFALEEIIRQLHATPEECYFWGTPSGAELDLLIIKDGKRQGFEFKYTDKPKITPSMRISMVDLKLDHLYIIFPGNISFPLTEQMTACGLDAFPIKD